MYDLLIDRDTELPWKFSVPKKSTSRPFPCHNFASPLINFFCRSSRLKTSGEFFENFPRQTATRTHPGNAGGILNGNGWHSPSAKIQKSEKTLPK
jgi:hypothetical protein